MSAGVGAAGELGGGTEVDVVIELKRAVQEFYASAIGEGRFVVEDVAVGEFQLACGPDIKDAGV